MRIVHVIDTLGPGGAEHSLLHVVTRWRAHEHDVVALGPGYDLAPPLEAAGVRVHRLGVHALEQLPLAAARVARLVRRRHADVVRGYLFLGGLTVALSAVGARAPLKIVSFHGLDYDAFPARGLAGRALKRIRGAVLRRGIDGYVGISRAVAEHYRRELGLPLDVIHNSFPVDELDPSLPTDRSAILARYGIHDANFVFVMPARYSVEKGHDVLLDALAELRGRGLAPHVLMFGHGNSRDALAARAAELGISDRTHFRDRIPQTELYDVLRAADALVLPTPHGEGFGRAPAEAMALEKPVVVSRVGGVLDFVVDGETGLLVEPFSSADLARALERLVLDRELGPRLGRAARHVIVTQFSIDAAIQRWEEYIAELQARRR